MKRYLIQFIGKKKGAIGIRYMIHAERNAEDADKAVLALYDEFEHIHDPLVREVDDAGNKLAPVRPYAAKDQRVCPNCGQWQRLWRGKWDCCHDCARRGFA